MPLLSRDLHGCPSPRIPWKHLHFHLSLAWTGTFFRTHPSILCSRCLPGFDPLHFTVCWVLTSEWVSISKFCNSVWRLVSTVHFLLQHSDRSQWLTILVLASSGSATLRRHRFSLRRIHLQSFHPWHLVGLAGEVTYAWTLLRVYFIPVQYDCYEVWQSLFSATAQPLLSWCGTMLLTEATMCEKLGCVLAGSHTGSASCWATWVVVLMDLGLCLTRSERVSCPSLLWPRWILC